MLFPQICMPNFFNTFKFLLSILILNEIYHFLTSSLNTEVIKETIRFIFIAL